MSCSIMFCGKHVHLSEHIMIDRVPLKLDSRGITHWINVVDPSGRIYEFSGGLLMHPDTFEAIKRELLK